MPTSLVALCYVWSEFAFSSTVPSMQGLPADVHQCFQQWSIECQTLWVAPFPAPAVLPSPEHPYALQHTLQQLTHLHIASDDTTVELSGWDWKPGLVAAIQAAPLRGPHAELPLKLHLGTLADDLLGLILQLGPRLQGVYVEWLLALSKQHKKATWSVTELEIAQLLLPRLENLPQCVGSHVCRVSCGLVKIDTRWQVSSRFLSAPECWAEAGTTRAMRCGGLSDMVVYGVFCRVIVRGVLQWEVFCHVKRLVCRVKCATL